MSNFTFGHNVFNSRLLLLRQNASAGGKGLNYCTLVYEGMSYVYLDLLWESVNQREERRKKK